MGNITVKENDLIDSKIERMKLIENVHVLDKVKSLFLLPNTELMTTRMVSEWFEVEIKTIEKAVQRNTNELTENGLLFKKYSDIKALVNSDNMSGLKISRQGSNVFSKRAVLNMAMLLRDSEIAKRVRSALLDHQEHLTNEEKIIHIDTEKELALKIMFAPTEGDKYLAFNEYNEFKNRHIKELEKTIEIQKPKVQSFDLFINGQNVQKMNDVAKSIGYGRNKLYNFLREHKILMKDNLPYQKYIDSYFVVKETPIERGGFVMNKPQTYVTAKGVNFISKLLHKHNII